MATSSGASSNNNASRSLGQQPGRKHNGGDAKELRESFSQISKANPLTYPKSNEPFSLALFKAPSSEYRGCPLWAWNSRLRKDHLLRQIDRFEEMGMGGFHMHVRTGLDTEYMGAEFMDRVKDCVDYAEQKNMMACLYDDDRWPSGSAGGQVIKGNPGYKAQHVLFTPFPYGTGHVPRDWNPSSAQGCRSENGYLLARYAIVLNPDGTLKSGRRLKHAEIADMDSTVWYAYVETNPPSAWFNDQTYVDSMSKDAMARFIEITHEVYKNKIGDRFGSTVPCIFTDEPQVATKIQLSSPTAKEDVFLPWTTDLAETFAKTYGKNSNLVDDLPQLFWNLPNNQPSLTRYRFHDHVSERFVSAFLDQLGSWCQKNRIMLNGHMMEEPTLWSQTTAHGEAMRCYRAQQLPGIDLLNDWVEYNTAKQASSVARQKGVRGTMSEIYGCTHWYFTFEGHMGCGNWQAALGITFRVQHLTWVSMAGEGKRDYPASIGYQSPWYREYRYIEDHFARLGVVLTRGRPVTRVAVVHPIESFWLCFGPNGSGDDEMASRNKAFADLTDWLLHGLVDFDFISESLLPGQVGQISRILQVGKCEYDVVILPNLRTIRSSTLQILKKFAASGGQVIIAGSGPQLVDAATPSASLLPVIRPCIHTSWDKWNILSALDSYRELRVTVDGGKLADTLLYQLRQDGNQRFLFACNTDRNSPYQTEVSVKGLWEIHLMDTFTGSDSPLPAERRAGWTVFPHKFEGCGSLLLRLTPSNSVGSLRPVQSIRISSMPSYEVNQVGIDLQEAVLSESNVLMLDYATYKVDGGNWSDLIEVLRIDNQLRERLKMPRKGMAWKQPWAIPESDRAPKVTVTLKFEFFSKVGINTLTKLALENPDPMVIRINGIKVSSAHSTSSWWVDEDIKTISVPKNTFLKGRNVIELSFPFGILTSIERLYVLGEFDVQLHDNKPVLAARSTLKWGDITSQGLPFYVGNITYKCRFTLRSRGAVTLSVPRFSSPLLKIASGTNTGVIALQPRSLSLGTLAAGTHMVEITAFGNRYNAFGHIHLTDGIFSCWPELWRTDGWAWSEEYRLKPVGILEQPSLLIESAGRISQDDDWVLLDLPHA